MPRQQKPRQQFLRAFENSCRELAAKRLDLEVYDSDPQGLGALVLAGFITHANMVEAMHQSRRGHVNMRGQLEVAAEIATAQAEIRFDAARAVIGACLSAE